MLYEKVYCARGRMENLIKDMKLYTRSDLRACVSFQVAGRWRSIVRPPRLTD